MSIRIKLIALVLFTSFAGFSSILVNNIILSPVSHIKEENQVLEELSYHFVAYMGQVNQLDSEDFREQLEKVNEVGSALDEASMRAEQLSFLPSINNSIASSIDTILLFFSNMKIAQRDLNNRIQEIMVIADRYVGKDKSFSIMQLAWGVDQLDESSAYDIKEGVFLLEASVRSLNRNANIALTNIESQYDIINEEIKKYENRSTSILGIILPLVILLPLGIALSVAGILANRIRKIEAGIYQLKEGNLADRIEVKGRDEMERLSRNINDFTDKLSVSMIRIKGASKTNLSIQETLLSSVGRVSEMTNEANDSVQTISAGVNELTSTVQITDRAVLTVDEQLNHLENAINDQVSMVEETTASVTEIIASVGNISDITSQKKAALTSLATYTREGGEMLHNTNEIITKVHSSIEEIQSTTYLIEDIASRTNLLAMNAAIEAAHAGDKGNGFAIVSSEIRKLAEATSKNSQRIDGVMQGIIGNIEAAAESGRSTDEVFQRIDQEVTEACASFDEIARSMEELKIGGQQILETMMRLNDISEKVKSGDRSMKDAAVANRDAIVKVENISEKFSQQVQRIIVALEKLANEMNIAKTASRRADEISDTLENEVKMFQVDEKIVAGKE